MKKVMLTMVLLTFLTAAAAAEEHFGVKVYPNAKADEATKGYCKQFATGGKGREPGLKTTAYCYRSSDTFASVTAFYRKHQGLDLFGNVSNRPGKKAAVFCLPEMRCAALGSGVDVTVTSPWGDDGNGQHDVLITIRQSRR